MQLHKLKSSKSTKAKARIGRGGKRGKTCGHGHKGQKQHGRHGIRPEMRDFIKKLPKLRGYGKNRARTVNSDGAHIQTINIEVLNTFKSDSIVTPKTLVDAGLVELQGGKLPKVKVLSNGELKVKIIVEDCILSARAKDKIIKVGGEVK